VRLWEVLTGEERRAFLWEGGDFLSLAMSGDGKVLAAGRPRAVVLWDVTGLHGERAEKKPASPAQVEALWTALAKDASPAHRAIWRLADAPAQSVPFLAEQLQAQASLDDPKRISRLIADLYDDHFPVRTRAMDELEALGRLAKPALEKELSGRPTLDVRSRIDKLGERMATTEIPPIWLRALRAIEALELSGTPEARQVLEKLADSPAGALLTAEARISVGRMKKR
jgi:hypothetical protein